MKALDIVVVGTYAISITFIRTKLQKTSNNYKYRYNNHGWKSVSKDFLPFELHRFDYQKFEHVGQQLIKVIADSEYLYFIIKSLTPHILSLKLFQINCLY